MIDVGLAYGSTGLSVRLPAAATTVITPRPRDAVPDPLATLQAAIDDPVAGPRLPDLARPGQRVAISVCDITRPQPRPVMLRAIMDALDGVIRPADVVVLIATGTHRASTTQERREMLGDEVLDTWRIIDHDARDRASLVDLGMVDDVPVLLAREWVEADLRITTGFVEPHFFAGFSGGPKMVAPGLAGLETTLALHNARRIGDPKATWGVIEGNPVHDAVRAITTATGVDFSVDVLLDDQQRITSAFAGEDAGDACGRLCRGQAGGDAARRCAVRRRDHDQQRLPARPEPVPGGQGHVGSRRDREDRAAPSSARRNAVTGFRTTGRTGSSCTKADRRPTCSSGSRPRRSRSPINGRSRSRPASRPRPTSCSGATA